MRKVLTFARTSIGTSLGAAFAQVFLLPLIQGFIMIVIIVSSFYVYRWFRSRKSSKDLCQTCPELKVAPRCNGIIHQYEANLKYQELILAVIDEKVIQERIAMNDGSILK